MHFYITGDTHRDFTRIAEFCEAKGTDADDVMIILGDAGINYYGGRRDMNAKRRLAQLPLTLFSIHGNHARIKLTKIRDYVKLLKMNGPRLVEPYSKHLEGEIYELRPASNRILYAGWTGKKYVLLHVFAKKTQKTPRREIDKAKRELEDFKTRFEE
jgi:phage-related protein